MVRARVLAAAMAAGLTVLTACSKSEDVPAGQTLFGSPPQIEVVALTDPGQQTSTVSCDFTTILVGRLCALGAPPDIQPDGPITIVGRYTQAVFQVTVSDPEGIENLLFVGASYVKPDSTQESTLVLFNDGSENRFPQSQSEQGTGVGQDCIVNEFECYCQGAKVYEVTSNDVSKTDRIYTRALAILPHGPPDLLRDCIMMDREQVPITIEGGTKLTFRIDAVDRDGNLDTWDTQPSVTVLTYDASDPSYFTCTGDECGCCMILNPNTYNLGICNGKPGLTSVSLGGAGVCSLF